VTPPAASVPNPARGTPRADAPAAVECTNLVYTFGSVRAVDDVSFDVSGGELFGLLGPNGRARRPPSGCSSPS
jgi:ABC-2 type transport system ATP-binding protein